MQNSQCISDERAILMATNVLGTSHPRLFELAYQDWYGRAAQEQDLAHAFASYLFAGEVPCWVRAFTRSTLVLCEEAGVEMSLNHHGHQVTTSVSRLLGRLVRAG